MGLCNLVWVPFLTKLRTGLDWISYVDVNDTHPVHPFGFVPDDSCHGVEIRASHERMRKSRFFALVMKSVRHVRSLKQHSGYPDISCTLVTLSVIFLRFFLCGMSFKFHRFFVALTCNFSFVSCLLVSSCQFHLVFRPPNPTFF